MFRFCIILLMQKYIIIYNLFREGIVDNELSDKVDNELSDKVDNINTKK
jgi:hypothetical protein